jgi:hypothetical protein
MSEPMETWLPRHLNDAALLLGAARRPPPKEYEGYSSSETYGRLSSVMLASGSSTTRARSSLSGVLPGVVAGRWRRPWP